MSDQSISEEQARVARRAIRRRRRNVMYYIMFALPSVGAVAVAALALFLPQSVFYPDLRHVPLVDRAVVLVGIAIVIAAFYAATAGWICNAFSRFDILEDQLESLRRQL